MGAKSAGPARHVEVEQKYDVPGSTVVPSFDGISTVARVERHSSQSLDAVYFDTSGHDLARHRITLRRRTGGADAGWHLKLPAGADARTEVHAPLDGGAHADGTEVPAELVDIVLAIVRDRPLVPVARIATTRSVVKLYARRRHGAGRVRRRRGQRLGDEPPTAAPARSSTGTSGNWS